MAVQGGTAHVNPFALYYITLVMFLVERAFIA